MSNVVVRRKPLKGWAENWPSAEEIQPNLSRSVSAPNEHAFQHPQSIMAKLPSKQDNAFATVRLKNQNDPERSFYNTVRGWMTLNRISGDMERGLAEDDNDDEDNPLDLDQIKELPISLGEKRLKMLHVPSGRAGNINEFKWRRKKFMRRMSNRMGSFFSKFQLWQRDMKKIEGNYGTGVVAYFVFIKWLTILNFFIFLMLFLFITLPTLISNVDVACDLNTEGPQTWTDLCCLTLDDLKTELNGTYGEKYSETEVLRCCNWNYTDTIERKSVEFLDIIQGTGRMEYTLFFYGFYENLVFKYSINETTMHYHFTLAYMLIITVVLFVSLCAVVRAASRGFNYKFHEGEEDFYQYCNLIFGGWDFCIDNEKAAQSKKTLLCNEIQACLDTERLVEEKKNRTIGERRKLFMIRVVINFIQIVILGGCGYGIYTVFGESSRMLREGGLSTEEQFLYEFLPSITITCINVVAPILFKFLIVYERYSPNFSIFVLLWRTVFLRLASIIMFYVSMYQKINVSNSIETCDSPEVLFCWETFVGQQIYRLALTDFATHVVLTFFVNYPRAFLARIYGHKSKFIKIIGEQTFDLPKHVLDIVYTQTLCWFGSFFAPLLPVMFVVIFFLMFYIKKFVCLVNSQPGGIIHRTSRSKFMVILLVAFIVAVAPIAFAVGEIPPSISCGPFREEEYAWLTVYDAFKFTPDWLKTVVEYIPSPGVSIAIFIVLVIFLYYYTATINANKHMVKALKTQLILEGHDKQLLLDRLAYFYKQQQQVAT